MSDYGNSPPPPPPPGGPGAYGAPSGGYGAPSGGDDAPQGYNAPPPPPDQMMSQASGELASWGSRVGGYIIDFLLLIPGYILYFIGAPKGTTTSAGTLTTTGGNILLILLGGLYILGVSIWNRWLKGGRTGQTVGRGVVGVKVVDQNSGQPIGAGKAFLRDLAHILDSIVCGLPIGWLWPLWDKKRQTWADKIIGTVAVVAPK